MRVTRRRHPVLILLWLALAAAILAMKIKWGRAAP